MILFTQHTATTAPQGAAEVLEKVRERYSFIPNLASYIAEAPVVLDAVMTLSVAFDNTSFPPEEQQLILLTISTLNGCTYCRTTHTGLGRSSGLSDEAIKAIQSDITIKDQRLNALYQFTKTVFINKGWVEEAAITSFLDAGFTKAQVFETIMGVALKTLTNYCNHIAGAEPNKELIAMAAMD